ncbi:MAG: MFS transporter [Cellulomonadaceae bacterium]|nr:MFS transporter [Cellulomonadaceae bacterium]
MSSEPLTPNPWWVAVVAGMASYIDAAAIAGFSAAIVILQHELGLGPAEVGLAAGGMTAGIAVGAFTGGRLGDRFGRRPVFCVTMGVILLATVGLLLASSFAVVACAAILLGLATGADLPVSLATIAEAADDSNRGRMIALSNLFWAGGYIITMLVTALVGDGGRWGANVIFIHVGTAALLVLFGRLTIPESKSWRAAAERIRAEGAGLHSRSQTRELFRAPYLVPFAGLVVFYAMTNLVANTSGQFGTYILVNFGGLSVAESTLVVIPILPLTIIGFLWFIRIADSPRRFAYFRVGAVAFVLSPLIVAVFGVSVPVNLVAGAVGAVGMIFASEGIMKVWTQEQFPTLLRATAQGAIISVARFTAAALALATPLLLELGTGFFYSLMALFGCIGVTTAWIVFRTRDQVSTPGRSDLSASAVDAHVG